MPGFSEVPDLSLDLVAPIQAEGTVGCHPAGCDVVDRHRGDDHDEVEIPVGEKVGVRWRVRSTCLLYTSPSPRDLSTSRMPSSA